MKKYTPEIYGNELKGISLKNVFFIETSSKIFPDVGGKTEETIKLNINSRVKMSFDAEKKIIIGLDIYSIDGLVRGKKIIQIKMQLMAVLETESVIGKDFLDKFKRNTLKLITYPYVREFVNDITAKMGLPPLVLPIWTNVVKIKP